MSRAPIALLASVVWFIAYIVGAVTLAGVLAPMHWAVQALYFLVAGVLWVGPVVWLMRWSVGRHQPREAAPQPSPPPNPLAASKRHR